MGAHSNRSGSASQGARLARHSTRTDGEQQQHSTHVCAAQGAAAGAWEQQQGTAAQQHAWLSPTAAQGQGHEGCSDFGRGGRGGRRTRKAAAGAALPGRLPAQPATPHGLLAAQHRAGASASKDRIGSAYVVRDLIRHVRQRVGPRRKVPARIGSGVQLAQAAAWGWGGVGAGERPQGGASGWQGPPSNCGPLGHLQAGQIRPHLRRWCTSIMKSWKWVRSSCGGRGTQRDRTVAGCKLKA